MFLFHLIYVSEKTAEMKSKYGEKINQLVTDSKVTNDTSAVSGMLFSADDYFLQWLEGSRLNVNDTFQRIAKDSRHQRVTLVRCGQLDERKFPDWAMSLINIRRTESAIYRSFLPDREFNPYLLNGDTITRFIETTFDHVRRQPDAAE